MKLTPQKHLSESQIDSGLKLIIKDGLAAEVMATLTGGAFLVALALSFGASNFQIGLLAALPTLANVFQLVAIYLVFKYQNRKLVTVYSTFLARTPLLIIGFLPFLFSTEVSLNILILMLFFHYFFGAISGCSWTSWMKDLVPQEKLGTYFSHRSRLIQILSVCLSFSCAFLLDYVKSDHSSYEITTYSIMFLIGGIVGISGVVFLVKTPEPQIHAVKTNLLKLYKKPLKNVNFRNLMIFNAFWVFAINLAAPFFSVYMLKMLHLKISYVVGFGILSQVTNILFIRVWGRFSDKYSNKSILRLCAPVYLFCILGWTFTTMPKEHFFSIPLLTLIYILNGISTAGINLSLSNIGMKLAPKEGDAIAFLTARGMTNALFAGIAPVIGGLCADFFSTRQLTWNLEWKSPDGNMVFHTLDLQQWDFFFVFAFILGLFALYRLSFVKESGEVKNKVIMKDLAAELSREVNMNSTRAGLRAMIYLPISFFELIRKKQRKKSMPEKMQGQSINIRMSDSSDRELNSKAS